MPALHKDNTLKKRIFSSLVLITGTAAAAAVDWVCGLAVTFIVAAALREFFGMLEKKGLKIYKRFGILVGAVIPFSIMLRFELTRGWELFFLAAGLLTLIILQFSRRDNSGAIVDISVTIFGIIYIAWFLSFLIKIRYMEGGLGLIVVLLLIAKGGDIGAYLIGRRFGRTPLLPRISPRKSVEGAAGGLLFSAAAGTVGGMLLKLPMTFPQLLFIGISLGILAQLGDLSESLVKRDCQVKDSGNFFPGMGGILDVVDSLIFTAPVFYFYLTFNTYR
ncbi:MAG: phosphatidate cytidylyltransferase [Candidatus Omnitrophota bacterium]|jgi:phosphatidate cytidylyltransferase|nr:phosphatidate cytidylyltransferase [Candidatus Omnitrophota bacterium]MDD3982411.1 phosphatidate cytidylyltransferase [Candidatus Omnitrophota bacterium]